MLIVYLAAFNKPSTPSACCFVVAQLYSQDCWTGASLQSQFANFMIITIDDVKG